MQDQQSYLRFAGDVSLEQVSLHTLNGQNAIVTAQVISAEIYEDLFSPFMTVSIVLRESVDYINMFPFIGEEYLYLRISTPNIDKPIEGKFYIYKISDRQYTKDREVVYTIKGISEEYLFDANKKLSQTFKGNCGEIALKLFEKAGLNTSKTCFIEKTSNKTAFTAAFWPPTKCLSFLSTNAMNESISPTYLLYENRDGFNFRSVDELLKKTSYHKFIKDNFTRSMVGDNTAAATKDPEEDFKRILELDIPVLTDYMEDIQSGRLKSRIISHDLVTKQYHVRDYSIKKDTEHPPTLLNPNPAFSQYATTNSISTMVIMPRHFANFSNFADVTNYNTVQKRMSFFQNLQKYKVTIQVLGRSDYTVGQVMELEIPRATQITKDQNDSPYDDILSGRYLLSGISHIITKEGHTCNMELIKNSIILDMSKQK